MRDWYESVLFGSKSGGGPLFSVSVVGLDGSGSAMYELSDKPKPLLQAGPTTPGRIAPARSSEYCARAPNQQRNHCRRHD